MRRLMKAAIAFAVVGNLAIYFAHRGARTLSPPRVAQWAAGTRNSHEIDDRLWRSGKPTPDTYRAAAADGVSLIVDLRSEGGAGPDESLGLQVLHLPVRDGQPPSPDQIDSFLAALESTRGPTLVHCSAGVGRTGSMVAAYRVLETGANPLDAMIEALAVGPPSLEQLAFILGLPGRRRPPALAIVLSRILDAPRRSWSRIRRAMARSGPDGRASTVQPT